MLIEFSSSCDNLMRILQLAEILLKRDYGHCIKSIRVIARQASILREFSSDGEVE